MDEAWIMRQICYASGYFDNQTEIAANPDHRIVVAARLAADRIVKRYDKHYEQEVDSTESK